MPKKRLRVAACQMHANEDIEKNTKKIVERIRACARSPRTRCSSPPLPPLRPLLEAVFRCG